MRLNAEDDQLLFCSANNTLWGLKFHEKSGSFDH